MSPAWYASYHHAAHFLSLFLFLLFCRFVVYQDPNEALK